MQSVGYIQPTGRHKTPKHSLNCLSCPWTYVTGTNAYTLRRMFSKLHVAFTMIIIKYDVIIIVNDTIIIQSLFREVFSDQ